MRAITAFALAIAALSLTQAASSALAQDVAPETPPELRDFRLDRQPGQPAQPTAEPVTTTPPSATATVPVSETPAPRVQIPAPTQRGTTPPVAEATVSEAPIEATAEAPSVTTTDQLTADDNAPEEAEPQPVSVPSSSSASWWPIAAGLGLFGLLLAAFVFLRRSPNRTAPHGTVDEQAVTAAPPKAAVPIRPAAKPAPPISTVKPRLTIDFIPEKASISFTALTIKGELRIINGSDGPAKNMQLRAALISTSEKQENEISSFHNAPLDTQTQNLGDVQAGERIGMRIELTVPLADLQSFPLGDQQLFVPIMVGNIAYSDEAGTLSEAAKIACMIGREANPPKPKMAPLRLDLGPRSFSPLGQRPLLI